MKMRVAAVILACGVSASAQSYAFRSTWKADDVKTLDLAGKRVAAVLISDDSSLRMSVEEAVARELSARGRVGVAAYRSVPAELLKDPDKARAWLEKTGVSSVIVMRVLSVDKEKVASAVVWSTMYYQDFNNYYATGWGGAVPLRTRQVTTIAVETLLFDVAKGKLLWGSVTESSNPKNVQTYITGLANEIAKELEREGLVSKSSRPK
jgi:hypothetical protein